MLKRVGLFLLTNLMVIVLISVLLSIFNVGPYITNAGLNIPALLVFSLIVGFAGSFISLALSKWMAKRAYNIEIINQPRTQDEAWLVGVVQDLAGQMRIGMPEVGIYHSPEANAFATGMRKNKALVAVSTGLLDQMSNEEIEAVLAHEVGHVANGDMITLALIQGVVNTFVVFFARVAAYLVTSFFSDDEEEGGGVSWLAYMGVTIVFELLFGILASTVVMWFSRQREYRADAASARAVGPQKMISALQRLKMISGHMDPRGKEFATMKISGGRSLLGLFSSHPPLDARIKALQKFA